MRMEVRCCCQPQKLLGTVEVPDYTRPGDPVVFSLMQKFEFCYTEETTMPERPSLKLWCASWSERRNGKRRPAIKAEGVGLDVLRHIPSFRENYGPENLPKD